GIWIGARLLEPWMLIRGVVDYEIDRNANAALFGAVSKLDEIPECTVPRIDIVIVGDVVTIVSTRRSLKRHQPNRGHAQSMQIIEAAHQSSEITGPIAISVHVSTDRQAVDDRVLVPKIVDHMRSEAGDFEKFVRLGAGAFAVIEARHVFDL